MSFQRIRIEERIRREERRKRREKESLAWGWVAFRISQLESAVKAVKFGVHELKAVTVSDVDESE